MNIKAEIVMLIILSWFLSSEIFARESLKNTFNITDLPEYTLDEITVTPDKSMRSFRMEVIRAEELKFKMFNDLNSTDEFDITCEWRAAPGTRIRKWSCDVGYLKNARTKDVQDMLNSHMTVSEIVSGGPIDKIYNYSNLRPLRTDQSRQIELAWKKRALNEEMVSLAVEHPKLALAMIRANTLQQLYEAEGRKRYKKNILFGNSGPVDNDEIINEIDILEAAYLDHSRGVISDEVWERWDNTYRMIFNMKSYQILWSSDNDKKKYNDEFIRYVNSIISGK